MSHNAIEIEGLRFGYNKKESILNELNLIVPQGSIYGFLGKNGAGKSTTIRNILGLLKPQDGKVNLLGKGNVTNDRSLFQDIGSLIESPSLYTHLSAKQNMNLACKLRGISTKNVEQVLDDVGLKDTKRKKAGNFSMGMKQRLGLALALIHDPRLLILDEPTNGLDPQGINEMRVVIKGLKEQGKTIMLSSHLLSEIEKTATHIGILNNEKIVFEGSIDDLVDLKAKESIVIVKLSNPSKAESIIEGTIEHIEGNFMKIKGQGQSFIPNLIKKLCKEGIDIYEVKVEKPSLEQLFMNITK